MRIALVLAIAALSGCDNAKDTYARSVAEDAQRRAIDAGTDLATIKQRLKEMDERDDRLSSYIGAVDKSGESLRKTVNHNAQVNNDNAVKDMTADGSCGREWVQFGNGTMGWQNRRCTSADLKKVD